MGKMHGRDAADQFQQKSKNILIGLFVLTCLGTLVFYWFVAPELLYHTLTGFMLSYPVLWGMIFLWSDASETEKAKRFFLTTGSIAFTVGFLELLVVAHIVDFRTVLGTPIFEPWRNPANLNDPKLLHIHKPYDRWVWEGIEYRYDQYGFRNETDLKMADLIVVGDSFVEGWGVSAADLLTNQLARQLNRPVANLGQSWYGPQQELELLRRYGLKLAPKVCVWVFFEGNDLWDFHRYKEATQDWENYSKDFHSFRQRSFTKNAVSAFGRLLNSMQNPNVSRMDHNQGQSGIFTSPSGEETRLTFYQKSHHLSEKDRIALEEIRLILGQAHKLCHAAEAKFLLVFVPTKFRVYRDFMEFDSHALPRDWVINDLPQKIEAMVSEDLPDVKFLDLTTVFIEQVKQESLLYFDDDTHWSAEGHRLAAAAIANVLGHWIKNWSVRRASMKYPEITISSK